MSEQQVRGDISQRDLSDAGELERVAERIKKVLELGKRGATPAEAEAAMARAQAMALAANLDLAAVEGLAAGGAQREKAAQGGGMYVYQRELWQAVAKLNFCMHWRTHVREPEPGTKKLRWRNKHMLVGRTVNVRVATQQAQYLEGVADRLCRERLEVRSGTGATPGQLNSQFFSSWAVAFREGISDEVIKKLEQKRERIEEEAAREERRRARSAERTGDGVSVATGVTLSFYKSKEEDANIDFLYGDGTSAGWAADRAERAAAQREERERRTRLAAEDPEAYAAEEAERRKERRGRGGRASPARRVDAGGYHAGREVGEKVGIDPQVDAGARRIGHG